MWIRFVLFLCCSVLAQDKAWLRRSNDRSGRCQYTFTVDSPVESSCPSTSSGMEMENLSTRLTLLEEAVSRVLGAKPGSRAGEEMGTLLQEKERLEEQVQELRRQVKELSMENEKLRDKPCPLRSTDGLGVVGGRGPVSKAEFQELKAELSEVPVPPKIKENVQSNTGCGELVSVGEPETHQKANSISGKYGIWFQDPESPSSPYGPETVWRIDAVGKDVRQLYAYENLEQLGRGHPTKVLLLPESMESTGATVYRGSLYYQRQRSPVLLRYNLASERITARRQLPHAGFHGQYPYSWGGYTDIDLAVDEKGLWAIYSTEKARGAIVISLLDPESLRVIRSWETNIQKTKVGNAFMVCGQLYTVASYGSNTTTINFSYDTASGQSRAVEVPFNNRYGYNSMIDYNAARRRLYAWDNFHMVTYDVQLGRASAA